MAQQDQNQQDPLAKFGTAATKVTPAPAADPLAQLGTPAVRADQSDAAASQPDISVKDRLIGPTTGIGTPLSPEMKSEASGVSDVFHGDVGQGVSKIWEAEKPHVIQGSFLEKAMQKIDPDFHGSVTPEQVQAHNAAYDAASRPNLDLAAGIDKTQHPVKAALAEATSSLTSLNSIATLYATGGLGLVDNPAALGFAKRLMSGGFSTTAIADAYKHYKGFREAVDNKNWSEAEYQITHAVAGGILGLLAAHGAASSEPIIDTSKPAPAANTPAAPAQPGLFARLNPFRGKEVAQVPATEAVHAGVEAAANKAGTPTPSPLASGKVLAGDQTVLDAPLTDLATKEKAAYKQVDDVAGFDVKAAKLQLKNDQFALTQLGNTPEAIAKRVDLSRAIDDTKARVAEAEKKLSDAGIAPKAADVLHTQRMAGQDFKNALVKATAPDGTINVDRFLTASKNLRFAKRGDRLAQYMGKDAADDFMDQLSAAQKKGAQRVKIEKGVKWAATAAAAYAGGHALIKGAEAIFGD